MEGAQSREERAWNRAAWMVAYLLQPHSKELIQPRDLLKPSLPDADSVLDPAGTWDALIAKAVERNRG